MRFRAALLVSSLLFIGLPVTVKTQVTVSSHQKISETQGNLGCVLGDVDLFGQSMASLPDLDGDGVRDLAVGSQRDDDGGQDRGAVYILFMNSDGSVKSHAKISSTEGGGPMLSDDDEFGTSVAWLGDFGSGAPTSHAMAVGADLDGSEHHGSVYLLFLDSSGTNPGTVVSYHKIDDTEPDLMGAFNFEERFGNSLAYLGDLGPGADTPRALAVGAIGDNDGAGVFRGAVWLLFLDSDGSVYSHLEISATDLPLADDDRLGTGLSCLGDLDGSGSSVCALASGAAGDDSGGERRGAVWILFLNNDGTLGSSQKVSDVDGDFGGVLDDYDAFGSSVASLGDWNGDSVPDLAVGAPSGDDAPSSDNPGSVWILYLTQSGTVLRAREISSTAGCFMSQLDDDDRFGNALCTPGDLDGNGVLDLAIGAIFDDDGCDLSNLDRGAVYVVFLDACPPASWSNYGTGHPGTNGIPKLTIDADPVLGSTITLLADNSLGALTTGVLFIGLSDACLPLKDGKLLVNPLVIFIVPVPPAGLALPGSIPCNTGLCGISLFLQLLEVDPGASRGISFTPGLEMILGS